MDDDKGAGHGCAHREMHFKKQFKEPSDVGIILHDQIKSKWEKFIWHLEYWKGLVLLIIQYEDRKWWSKFTLNIIGSLNSNCFIKQ